MRRISKSNGKWYVQEKQMIRIGKLSWVIIAGPYKEKKDAKEDTTLQTLS